jgi:biofilm PGA synthesis N-glycosyltransferase PgaC
MKIVFWISLWVVFYSYAGYPLLLLVLRFFIDRPVRKQFVTEPENLPSVTIIVAAMNEESVIAEKIRNVQSLDYPPDKLELLIASDGSSDDTVRIAEGLSDGVRIRVLAFVVNRGKVSVLNDAVREAPGEIILFSDASALLAADSVRQLVANFADPNVGAVSGTYRVLEATQSPTGTQEDTYWKYETFLKVQESRLASVLGGHGQILAVRKELYPFPAAGTVNDDFVIPLRILAGGKRVVYESKAIAYERAREMAGFRRRVRILAGNLQQSGEIRGLLAPLQILPVFFFLSHKVARSVVPFFLVILVVLNTLLGNEKLFQITGILQLTFYLLALVGSRWRLRPRALQLPYYFCFVNFAYLWGFFQTRAGGREVRWK